MASPQPSSRRLAAKTNFVHAINFVRAHLRKRARPWLSVCDPRKLRVRESGRAEGYGSPEPFAASKNLLENLLRIGQGDQAAAQRVDKGHLHHAAEALEENLRHAHRDHAKSVASSCVKPSACRLCDRQ
eukprot:3624887-Pleurochrysis_carterae.AAC.6